MDLGDECCRPNVLVTSLRCLWPIKYMDESRHHNNSAINIPNQSPSYTHDHKVTNITMSPTSLSPFNGAKLSLFGLARFEFIFKIIVTILNSIITVETHSESYHHHAQGHQWYWDDLRMNRLFFLNMNNDEWFSDWSDVECSWVWCWSCVHSCDDGL